MDDGRDPIGTLEGATICWRETNPGISQRHYRAGGIRTRGLLHPRQALYQAEPQPELLPRSNRREHLFRVLRGWRQDRIREQSCRRDTICISFVRGAAASLWRRPRPNQTTSKQTINQADEIYFAAPHGGVEESAYTKPLRSNLQLGKERSFPGRERHPCWRWKPLTHPLHPWAPRRTGHSELTWIVRRQSSPWHHQAPWQAGRQWPKPRRWPTQRRSRGCEARSGRSDWISRSLVEFGDCFLRLSTG